MFVGMPGLSGIRRYEGAALEEAIGAYNKPSRPKPLYAIQKRGLILRQCSGKGEAREQLRCIIFRVTLCSCDA